MGSSKAMLPFGDRTLLQRVADCVEQTCQAIVVVAAQGQLLPELPESVIVVHDSVEGQGPLEGIRIGLRALPDNITSSYVTSCDVPFLKTVFIEFMFTQLGTHDVAVAVENDFFHPLAGVYRVSMAGTIDNLFESGERRPRMLFNQVSTKRVSTDDLKSVDPNLESLINLNDSEQYHAALEALGIRNQ